MTDLLAVQAARDRRWRRLLIGLVIAYVITTLTFLFAIGIVANRLDQSSHRENQLRCGFALQGTWNTGIVNYLDNITSGGTPQDRARIRSNLAAIARQQAGKQVCPEHP